LCNRGGVVLVVLLGCGVGVGGGGLGCGGGGWGGCLGVLVWGVSFRLSTRRIKYRKTWFQRDGLELLVREKNRRKRRGYCPDMDPKWWQPSVTSPRTDLSRCNKGNWKKRDKKNLPEVNETRQKNFRPTRLHTINFVGHRLVEATHPRVMGIQHT